MRFENLKSCCFNVAPLFRLVLEGTEFLADLIMSLRLRDLLKNIEAGFIKHSAPDVVKAAELVCVRVAQLEGCTVIKQETVRNLILGSAL